MKERIEEIFAKMDEFLKESNDHATKGNKLAGRRARMASLEIAKMLKEYRWVSVEWDKGNK
jgi:hypothetical protein